MTVHGTRPLYMLENSVCDTNTFLTSERQPLYIIRTKWLVLKKTSPLSFPMPTALLGERCGGLTPATAQLPPLPTQATPPSHLLLNPQWVRLARKWAELQSKRRRGEPRKPRPSCVGGGTEQMWSSTSSISSVGATDLLADKVRRENSLRPCVMNF